MHLEALVEWWNILRYDRAQNQPVSSREHITILTGLDFHLKPFLLLLQSILQHGKPLSIQVYKGSVFRVPSQFLNLPSFLPSHITDHHFLPQLHTHPKMKNTFHTILFALGLALSVTAAASGAQSKTSAVNSTSPATGAGAAPTHSLAARAPQTANPKCLKQVELSCLNLAANCIDSIPFVVSVSTPSATV